MDTNPLYGVSKGEEKATAFSSAVTNSATNKQYNYDYVHDDHFLHHNTSATTTNAAKDDNLQIDTNVDQSSSTRPAGDGEYGVVNQPKN